VGYDAVESGMTHISGHDRPQTFLLPEAVDDYVGPNNPVRFIDAFVDGLDLAAASFTRVEPKVTGRLGYAPTDLLKLYIYGYLNRVRSSRRLEAETHRNIEVNWLPRHLKPDFKTIADFRRDNRNASAKSSVNLCCSVANWTCLAGTCDLLPWARCRRPDARADSRKGADFARRVLQVAGGDPGSLANAAFALAYFGEDIGAMMALVDRALALNPGFARGWHVSGALRAWAGQPEVAIEHVEVALASQPASLARRQFCCNRPRAPRQPPLRRGSPEASSRDPGISELPGAVSLSRRLLRPYGSARRSARDRRAAAHHHVSRGPEHQLFAERGAP
jgi:transposase